MNDETLTLLGNILTVCFVGTFIVLGVVGFFVFTFGKDVAFKKKWFPRSVILAGVLFVLFSNTVMVIHSRSFSILAILIIEIPFVALISYLNIRATKFCDNCGATAVNHNPFSRMRFCSKCGAEFGVQPKPTNSTND